ncbi:hypothetical protein Daus18300_013561 [Diaporthe australafricana]|uniref:Carboxylic ester hydrolase n=1 Tax=Diaporthe australafricana TaxID=127596 RepID=A0ABR3VYN2_9PEZI
MIPSLFNGSVSAGACSAANLPYPTLFGAEFLSLQANPVSNFSQASHIGLYVNHGAVAVENLNFCNVTISYTHPGQNDKIHVQVWMPSGDAWNGRLQMLGGAGWQAGLHMAGLMGMASAASEGYASFGTDGGLGSDVYPTDWALVSDGNVNQYLLQDLASVSLNDASVIAKDIAKSYYGQAASYTYYSGCSQGGRQGLMLAQRYPDAFDGIAASAPAINWAEFFLSYWYPSVLMDQLEEYPPSCEIDAITAAAVEACDGLDGVVDNVISYPDLCDFDPASVVGQVINCTNFGDERPISAAAATLVQAAWDGPKRGDNSSIWFGLNQDSVLGDSAYQQGIISTTCGSNGTCTLNEIELATDWVKLFLYKNSNSSTSHISHEEFDRLAHLSKNMYESIISANDPDLSEFRARGGKIVGYHGLADNIIAPGGSKLYYENVLAQEPNAQDFYRLFFAPGLGHCFTGPGAYPDSTFDAMREWVETGVAPEILNATSTDAPIISRPLCPYPQEQKYDGVGNSTAGEGFYCE